MIFIVNFYLTCSGLEEHSNDALAHITEGLGRPFKVHLHFVMFAIRSYVNQCIRLILVLGPNRAGSRFRTGPSCIV